MNLFTRLFRKQSSFPDVTFKEREVTNGNEYEVYSASTRAIALEFLRGTEIREERKYVIVEAPGVTLGKDLIMIFDEKTSARLEYGVRKPLAAPRKSATHCSRCGYPVLPAGAVRQGVKELILLDDMKAAGVGFTCRLCLAAWCPFCVRSEAPETCLSCGQPMDILREW